MKPLLEELTERGIHLSTEYYGVDDLGTGWEIRGIVENDDLFGSLYEYYPLNSLASFNDFVVYLYSLKFSLMSDVIPLLIHDEHKTILRKLISESCAALERISKRDLIQYINGHIKDIFPKENCNHDIVRSTISIIAKYSSGISRDAYSFLCQNYGYLLIDKFEEFENMFENNSDLFSNMYPTGTLSELEGFRFEKTLEIFAHIWNKKQSTLKETVNRILPVLCDDARALVDTTDYREVLSNEQIIRHILSFLKAIGHPLAYEFSSIHRKIENQLGEGLKEHGQTLSFGIPLPNMLEKYRSVENWQIRLLYITHIVNADDSEFEFVSQLSNAETAETSFIDMVSTNFPKDEHFTFSQQAMLASVIATGEALFWGILRDTALLDDYMKMVLSAALVVSDTLKCSEEAIEEDAKLLKNMINSIASNSEESEEISIPLCYSASMFLCAFIEKLLRTAYITLVRGKRYVPVEKITLGNLLNKNNPEIISLFGETHIRHLSFFLSQEGEKRIGHNYRNRLAHWNNINAKAVNTHLVLRLLWLFTDVLNTVFWYCLRQPPSDEENDEKKNSD